MKTLSQLMFLILVAAAHARAQAPQKFSYQTVIRNGGGQLLSNQQVSIKISIIQGNENGLLVFSERHTPTTNANGLATLQIGAGTLVTGNFTGIDWTQGPYFITSETDPNGGTNYTIVATQQLLSVPYALYAETSGSSIQGPQGPAGPQGEQGPIGLTGPQGATGSTGAQGAIGLTGPQGPQGPIGLTGPQGAAGAQGPQGSSGSNGQNTLVKTTTEPISFSCLYGGVKVEYGLDANGNGTLESGEINSALTKYVCNGATGQTGPQGPQGQTGATGPAYTGNCNYEIGQNVAALGGIIFYLDPTGCHGLVCASTDQSSGIFWDAFVNSEFEGAVSSCVGCGDGNTTTIYISQGSLSCAAQLCYDLVLNNKSDWYLPSKYELYLMYQNIGQGNSLGLGNIGGFLNTSYWSSSERDSDYAWSFLMGVIGIASPSTKESVYDVRAIRAF